MSTDSCAQFRMVRLLTKLETGESLSDEECLFICEAVFRKPVSAKYAWIRDSKVRIGAGSASAGSSRGDRTDGSRPDEMPASEVDDADLEESPADYAGTVRADVHGSADGMRSDPSASEADDADMQESPAGYAGTARGEVYGSADGVRARGARAAEEQISRPRSWIEDPIYRDALNMLWAAFCKGKVWQHALNAARKAETADSAEQQARAYLYRCAVNAVKKWLSQGTVKSRLYESVREALADPRYDSHGALDAAARLYTPADHPEWDRQDACFPAELCRGLLAPSLAGKTKGGAGRSLPTPTMIRLFVDQVFEKHRCALAVGDIIDILMAAYGLSSEREVELPPDDINSGPPSDAGREGDRKDASPVASDLCAADIQLAAAGLVGRVEEIDGCAIDPPPANREQGKLGRLLLDYLIWYGWEVTDGTARWYNMSRYEALSGYSDSQEKKRLDDILTPLVAKVCTDNRFMSDDLLVLIGWLRQKYLHRKPEFVGDGPFYGGERQVLSHD